MRDCLLKFYKSRYHSMVDFEHVHDFYEMETKIPIFGETDRNCSLVKDFHKFFDTDYEFVFKYLTFIKDVIKPLFPLETKLVIQKTPNIRFHLPGCSNIGSRKTDTDDKIGLHYDNEFGHPLEEINIVFALTKMFDTNSIYYQTDGDEYINMKLDENEFFIGNLNTKKHYNKINETNQTRVSLDFRIIPYSKFKNGLRTYYMLF